MIQVFRYAELIILYLISQLIFHMLENANLLS